LEIDITKVELSARGILKLLLAIVVFCIIAGIGYWIYKKLKGAVTGKTAPTSEW
jgi:hypothetical protein